MDWVSVPGNAVGLGMAAMALPTLAGTSVDALGMLGMAWFSVVGAPDAVGKVLGMALYTLVGIRVDVLGMFGMV